LYATKCGLNIYTNKYERNLSLSDTRSTGTFNLYSLSWK